MLQSVVAVVLKLLQLSATFNISFSFSVLAYKQNHFQRKSPARLDGSRQASQQRVCSQQPAHKFKSSSSSFEDERKDASTCLCPHRLSISFLLFHLASVSFFNKVTEVTVLNEQQQQQQSNRKSILNKRQQKRSDKNAQKIES